MIVSMSLLTIANQQFKSRLLVGTGKFTSDVVMKQAIEASGSDFITAALRRVDLNNPNDVFCNVINPKDYIFLTNTSGARTADEAIRLARLGKTRSNWVKLELTPEPNHLLPDPIETLIAAEVLVKEGMYVLPYINADPVLCKRLEDVGCHAVMPLGSPIGTNCGLSTRLQLDIIIKNSNVPVIIDAGIGAPSHAAEAMEMGADAVLVNTAIATATDPVKMADAFARAVQAGRDAFEAGLPKQQSVAVASSPLTGFIA
jgi:thiazole synthase